MFENLAFEEEIYMADDNVPEVWSGDEAIQLRPGETITVTTIERSVYQQFQQAAFQKYQQSVLTYGSRLFREARSVAHQRDPDANVVEITTPDVEAATVRTEMKLARLRQLRFPYRLIQFVLSTAAGYLIKLSFDLGNLPQGSPGKDFFLWVFIGCIACFIGIVVLYHFETRAELSR
jgi:hypothetical protein